MQKTIMVDGINVCIEDEDKFYELCKSFKENTQTDDFEGWKTEVGIFNTF